MPRYIDADELIEFIEDRYEITWDSDTYEGGIKDACTDILEKIDKMLTINDDPVKHGRWIYGEEGMFGNPYGHYKCSVCCDRFPHKQNYCPNCGARMDGENDG